jgi:prepilin-type N-terminal cleavage/methylation domain-containing protein
MNARKQQLGSAGMTLLEVVISAAILSVLALTMVYATIPVSRASSEVAIALDMDRTAASLMERMRRELRQSGFQVELTDRAMFGLDAVGESPNGLNTVQNKITFRIRTDMDLGDTTQADFDANWSSDIVYERVLGSPAAYTGVPTPTARYKVVRTEGGLDVTVCEDVSDFTIVRPAAGNSIIVTLALTRPNPNWNNSGTPPAAITRTYTDQIQYMNQNPSQTN